MISEEIVNQLVPQVRGGPSGFGDLGEVGSLGLRAKVPESLNDECVWIAKDTDLEKYGESTVIKCEFISSNVDDPYVIKTVDDTKLTITGEYGLATFDKLSYTFKDIETNEIFKVTGWPPTDPRAKYMFKFEEDSRSSRHIEYIVDYVIEFDFSPLLIAPTTTPPALPATDFLPEDIDIITDVATTDPLTYNFYVDEENEKAYRRDRVKFVQLVRNYSFRALGEEIIKAVS
jgi:hypothetical protein